MCKSKETISKNGVFLLVFYPKFNIFMIMKTIMIVITGGIAAYKSLTLIRLLKKAGYAVIPVMTESAKSFVTPLSVATLAESPVRTELFDLEAETQIGHIDLARKADLIVIAPATANFMAKIALGLADDLASTIMLANYAPCILAPAMNPAMWEAEPTQNHIKTLQSRGYKFAFPQSGEMACKELGVGRLAEPEDIFAQIEEFFQDGPLKGRHIILTSGPTHEPIDPVRYIANRSSGKQGVSLANALNKLGAKVTMISGPSQFQPDPQVHLISVETAQEMHMTVLNALPADVFIGAAAVADWRVKSQSKEKLKKTIDGLPQLEFEKNPDILAEISQSKNRPKLVIGFAAETQNLIEYAQAKRKRKQCDWIFANDVSEKSGIMGGDHTELYLIKTDSTEIFYSGTKQEVSDKMAEAIAKALEDM